MSPLSLRIYGIFCYLVFLVTILYLIGFVGNIIVPKSIDSGGERDLSSSLMVDVILLIVFAAQHSVMARPRFKRVWTKLVPQAIERSTYVLLASLVLALLFWQWRPLLMTIWEVRNAAAVLILQGLFAAGWGIVVMSTILINQSDMLGLRQVELQERYTDLGFRTPSLYKFTRHPIMLGFIIAFWATPKMTLGHLLFAVITTAYILIAIPFEERDLRSLYGDVYERYRRQVSMLLPLPGRRFNSDRNSGDTESK
jgi:protein-S-isoprenylcysteine O-methyltransferase Ste14